MQTSELKAFEKMKEGVVLFNGDGTFNYINQVAADLLWGHDEDDGLYKELEVIVSNLVLSAPHPSNINTLKNVPGNSEVKCSVSMINGYVLAVIGKQLDDRQRGFGLGSALDRIKNKLYVMSSVYVGGRPIMKSEAM